MADPTYNYLDYDGLALYDEKIKQLIGTKVDKDGSKVLSTNDYTTEEKNKLAGVTAGAEPNQNAFSTVSVDGTSLAADSKTDTLTITAGENVTLTPTASSDSFTIAATDTTYTLTKSGSAITLTGSDGSTMDVTDSDTTALGSMTGVLDTSHGGTGVNFSTLATGNSGVVFYDGKFDTMALASSAQIVTQIGVTPVNRAKADASGNNIAETYAKTTDVPSASSTTPKMDGTAAVGTETAYAKGDHVHPTDTSRAPLNSPTFTGTPKLTTTPAASDNSTNIASTAFVKTAIADAISGIQGISYEVVTTLPSTGQAGVIYLVSNSGSAPNIYDEYIWTGTAFEKIGTTDVDLSGYQPLMTAITNAQINGLFS